MIYLILSFVWGIVCAKAIQSGFDSTVN